MSDVDTHFKKLLRSKYFKRSEFENMDVIRPYMGNPFIQPGTIGARSQQYPKVIIDNKAEVAKR